MASIVDGWFREREAVKDGYNIGLMVEQVLFEGKSKYQDILVFKSTKFGNVLALDGCIQCTERDEWCYHEMIAHLPLCCHGNPRQVLVVGGGDGGVVREVLKHPSVEKVTLCEIDQKVLELCRKHLLSMSSCLDDRRVHVHVGDGVEYVKKRPASFDVIITDAPDPIGAAEGLYELEYYRSLKAGLKPGGVVCSQGQTLWLDLHVVKKLLTCCRDVFPSSGYATASIPTYASGQIGFILASTDPDIDFKNPVRTLSDSQQGVMELKYYTPEIHSASFALPAYARKELFHTPKQELNGDLHHKGT